MPFKNKVIIKNLDKHFGVKLPFSVATIHEENNKGIYSKDIVFGKIDMDDEELMRKMCFDTLMHKESTVYRDFNKISIDLRLEYDVIEKKLKPKNDLEFTSPYLKSKFEKMSLYFQLTEIFIKSEYYKNIMLKTQFYYSISFEIKKTLFGGKIIESTILECLTFKYPIVTDHKFLEGYDELNTLVTQNYMEIVDNKLKSSYFQKFITLFNEKNGSELNLNGDIENTIKVMQMVCI